MRLGTSLGFVLLLFVALPATSQEFLRCGKNCVQTCAVLSCSEVQCRGLREIAGQCECKIEIRQIFGTDLVICRAFGGPCELGCGGYDEAPIVSHDLLQSGSPSFELDSMSTQVRNEIQEIPGLYELVTEVARAPLGRTNVMMARALEGIKLPDGSQAYDRAWQFAIHVEQSFGSRKWSVYSEEGNLLVEGRSTNLGKTLTVLSNFSGTAEAVTFSW